MKRPSLRTTTRRAPSMLAAMLLGVALLTAVTVAPSGATLAADKAKPDDKPKLSPEVGKPLKAAQDALEKQDWATAATHLKEAQDLPNKTEYDEFTTNQLYIFLYLHTNDFANAEKSLEAVIGSQYLDKADLPVRIRTLAQLNYQLKDYDKAIQFSQRALKEGNANEDTYTILGQSYYLKGDYKGSVQVLSEHVDAQIKGGQTPPEDRLNLLLSSCV